MALNIDSLKDVRSLLYAVRRKWYSIGIELNIKIGELETIKDTYSDPAVCLIEVLKIWLKSFDPPPTWKALGDALEAEPVNEKELATKAHSYSSTTNNGASGGKVQASSHKYRATNKIETVIREADVRFLMQHLYDYGYKWEDIGLGLNFRDGELKNIKHSNPLHSTSQYLKEVLVKWSHWPTADHEEDPTLEKLCDALRSGSVGLGDIADVLDRAYRERK